MAGGDAACSSTPSPSPPSAVSAPVPSGGPAPATPSPPSPERAPSPVPTPRLDSRSVCEPMRPREPSGSTAAATRRPTPPEVEPRAEEALENAISATGSTPPGACFWYLGYLSSRNPACIAIIRQPTASPTPSLVPPKRACRHRVQGRTACVSSPFPLFLQLLQHGLHSIFIQLDGNTVAGSEASQDTQGCHARRGPCWRTHLAACRPLCRGDRPAGAMSGPTASQSANIAHTVVSTGAVCGRPTPPPCPCPAEDGAPRPPRAGGRGIGAVAARADSPLTPLCVAAARRDARLPPRRSGGGFAARWRSTD
jgi:hypothetical protein